MYWPSSIAVFGPTTPRLLTPQYTVMEPNTIYGISKQAGERYCEYYHQKYGVDVRSLGYPGLIGYKSAPGGQITHYSVHIYHEALKKGTDECFLSENTTLPMSYMPDALKATIGIMESEAAKVNTQQDNLAGMSFSPKEIAAELANIFPDLPLPIKPIRGSKLPTRGHKALTMPRHAHTGDGNQTTIWLP